MKIFRRSLPARSGRGGREPDGRHGEEIEGDEFGQVKLQDKPAKRARAVRRGRSPYSSTVDFATGIPSFRNSPRIPRATPRGLALEMSRISSGVPWRSSDGPAVPSD